MPPTAKQQAASKQNAVRHGYFVSGFLSDDERARYESFLQAGVEPKDLKGKMIAALIVRLERLLQWEAKGERSEKISGYTTQTFAELRQMLATLAPEELQVTHRWDDAEVQRQVETLLRDREFLVRQFPPRVQERIRGVLREENV